MQDMYTHVLCAGPALRATQTYTAKFGRRVAELHKQHNKCISTFLKHDKARHVIYKCFPDTAELEATMSKDLWLDADLAQVTAFVKRRLAKASLVAAPIAPSTPVVPAAPSVPEVPVALAALYMPAVPAVPAA